jgi:hypothetical protein
MAAGDSGRTWEGVSYGRERWAMPDRTPKPETETNNKTEPETKPDGELTEEDLSKVSGGSRLADLLQSPSSAANEGLKGIFGS